LHHPPLKNESANEVQKFARLNKTLISSSRNGRFNYRNFNFNSILERKLKEERNSRTEYNNNQYKIQQKKKLRIKRTLLLNKRE
jgi:hypothetical protein